MTNLLQETFDDIAKSGHVTGDVVWAGSIDGRYALDWDAFATVAADVDYDAGYGSNEVPLDLAVVFSDGSYLSRGEYDGSEWWEFHRTPQRTAAQPFYFKKEEGKLFSMTFRDFRFAAVEPARSNEGTADD